MDVGTSMSIGTLILHRLDDQRWEDFDNQTKEMNAVVGVYRRGLNDILLAWRSLRCLHNRMIEDIAADIVGVAPPIEFDFSSIKNNKLRRHSLVITANHLAEKNEIPCFGDAVRKIISEDMDDKNICSRALLQSIQRQVGENRYKDYSLETFLK